MIQLHQAQGVFQVSYSKAEKRDMKCECVCVILARVAREGLHDKVTSEQRLGKKTASHVDI